MQLKTFGPLLEITESAILEIKTAFNQLKEPPKLAILYVSIDIEISPLVKLIRDMIDIPVIGATTGAGAFTEKGMASEGFVGGFLAGNDIHIETTLLKNVSENPYPIMDNCCYNLNPENGLGHSFFILANDTIDGQIIANYFSKLPPLWRILGGIAGDGLQFKGKSKIFLNDEILSDSVLLTHIRTKYNPGIGVRHGFSPLPKDEALIVTEIEGRVLKTINNQPAAAVWKKYLILHNKIKETEDIEFYLTFYPFGCKNFLGEKWKLRSPLRIQGEYILLTCFIAKGSKIRIMEADNQKLLQSSKVALELAVKNLGNHQLSFQLVIECVSRKKYLGKGYFKQIQNYNIYPNCPILGFTSYGEFARYGGSLEGFHNQTTVVSIW